MRCAAAHRKWGTLSQDRDLETLIRLGALLIVEAHEVAELNYEEGHKDVVLVPDAAMGPDCLVRSSG